MLGYGTNTGGYARNGGNSSLNWRKHLAVHFPFQIPLLPPAASHLPKDCCSNNWSTQKRSRRGMFATCWVYSSIPFFGEPQLNGRRFERVCNDFADSGIESTCPRMRDKILLGWQEMVPVRIA